MTPSTAWSILPGDFDYKETTTQLAGTGPQQILRPDPSRWGVIFSAPSGGTGAVYISTNAVLTTSSGIAVPINGQQLQINFRDFGVLPGLAWYANGSAGSKITALEVYYRPWAR